MALQRAWYRPKFTWWLIALLPLHALFVIVSECRRWCYRWGWCARYKAPIPVIVVGNISVGGTGKTPVTEALVHWLKQQGFQPAIISRGYGGEGPFPQLVTTQTPPSMVGDEPKLLAQRTAVPVVVGPNRQQAIELLIQSFPAVNIIISDDGLQHERLSRDLEIAVVDGERGIGNGWRLPIGPLRDPVTRLQQADLVVQNGVGQRTFGHCFQLQPGAWRRVVDDQPVAPPFGRAIAIAGIGHPQRFFATLQQLAIAVEDSLAFADHHPYSTEDFAAITHDVAVLMTEKDAAKCRTFARDNWYYLTVSAVFDDTFWQEFSRQVNRITQEP